MAPRSEARRWAMWHWATLRASIDACLADPEGYDENR